MLCSWLSNSPNYEEITKWYLGWKSMFSDQVLAHPSIKDKFNEALDIMNRAVSSNVGKSASAVDVLALGSTALNTEMPQNQSFQVPAGCLQLAHPRL